MEEERKNNEHQQIVDSIKNKLRELNLPISIPPHTVSNEFYHPDFCTRINHKFVTIEVINTDYGFDILGQLSLLLEKDIIEYAVCIVTEKVIQNDIKKYDKVVKEVEKLNKYCNLNGELIILEENGLENWLKEKVEKSELWKLKK